MKIDPQIPQVDTDFALVYAVPFERVSLCESTFKTERR
jgi:hypothetical protein